MTQNISGRRLKLLLSSEAVQRIENRVRRSASHEMDFPSAETALMTISFLTLAVFLIKLVLVRITAILLFNKKYFHRSKVFWTDLKLRFVLNILHDFIYRIFYSLNSIKIILQQICFLAYPFDFHYTQFISIINLS